MESEPLASVNTR